jgi:GNAT superfamily N-acetyltransferase
MTGRTDSPTWRETKMTHPELLALYDTEERITTAWPSFVREEAGAIVRHRPETAGPAGGGGFIAYSHLDDATADGVIEEQIDFFAGRQLRFGWKLYGHDTPADLANRLVAHGLEPQEAESIMVLDLRRVPPALLEPVTADVRQIRDPALLTDVQQVSRAVWDDDKTDLFAELGYTLRNNPDLLSVYVAYHDNKPVSVAWLRITEGKPFASLWGGSTLSGYRKQGFYTALLATRVQEAVERGASFTTVDAGPMSKPIVARFGFKELTTACDYDYTPEP